MSGMVNKWFWTEYVGSGCNHYHYQTTSRRTMSICLNSEESYAPVLATLQLPLPGLTNPFVLITLFCCFNICFAVNRKHLNLSTAATRWYPAGANGYGNADAAGSDGIMHD
ncbi:hypothetical protein FF1_001740 [Malus domestica]